MTTLTSPRTGPTGETPVERTGRHTPPIGFWLRWSLRDLRRRWLQVAAIALVIALGTGTYAGLTASSAWRYRSYDASYAAVGAHDLLIEVAEGTTVDRTALLAALDATPHPEWFTDVSTTLVVNVQVDASTDGQTILVPGRLVGVELADGGPTVDRLHTVSGRPLDPSDIGAPTVAADEHFVRANELPASGSLVLSGGERVDYVGTALSPRYFLISAETGAVFGAKGYAVLFTSLETAQAAAGTSGRVTEAGVRLADGVDGGAARAELEATLAATLPDAATTVTPLSEERGYRLLYDDIEGDQKVFTAFAVLVLAGAAFAAFNLTGRIVEAQRRELGVGMALGVPTRALAVRPLLVAFEVALLGVVLGVAVGLVTGSAMGNVIAEFFPLPVWETPFQLGPYVVATVSGIVLIVVASAWPVRRAVRVPPVEAITTGPRTTASGGLAPAVQRLALPGSVVDQLPVREVVRSPRRTLLTALGIAAAIAALVAILGMVDTVFATVDAGEAEFLGATPDRITVTTRTFTLADAPVVTEVQDTPGVGASSTGLRIGGEVSTDAGSIETVLELIDFEDAVWTPSVTAGALPTGGGDEPSLVLSEKAADDLGVGVGDRVTLRHPVREGLGYRWEESAVPVAALHPSPFRFLTYLPLDDAPFMNLEGIVNQVDLVPAPGTDVDVLRRDLFDVEGVGAVEPVSATIATLRETLDEFLGILSIITVIVLLLAVLIAFNSSSISADERAREHATMFAFGLPVRTVLRLAVTESAIIGAIATVIGVLLGLAMLGWLVNVLIADTMPELRFTIDVRASTYLTAALLGVVAVSLAPLLTLRRLRRMDIPSTLRVVE